MNFIYPILNPVLTLLTSLSYPAFVNVQTNNVYSIILNNALALFGVGNFFAPFFLAPFSLANRHRWGGGAVGDVILWLLSSHSCTATVMPAGCGVTPLH